MQIGTNVAGTLPAVGYTILASMSGFDPVAQGLTIDWTTIAAEASSRTLPSGYVTRVGEKIIPAGTTVYAITSGSATSKYGVAASATTLVIGETFVSIKDISYDIALDHVGDFTASAEIILARLQYGGSLPSLANIRAAMPTLRTRTF